MKRFMSVFIKGFLRYPRNGLLVSCLAIFLLGWLFLPATSLLSNSAYAAKPNTPQDTPTPFLFASQLEGLLIGNGSRSENYPVRSDQDAFHTRNTPLFSPFQIIRQTQKSLLQTQGSPTSSVAFPVQGLSANVTGIKSVRPYSASIGERLRFTIELTNNANDNAIDIKVTDDFPLFLTITRVTTTDNRGEVDITDNQVAVFFQSLDPRRTVVIDIDTVVNNTAYGDIVYYNTAYFTYYYINTPFQGQTNAAPYQVITGLITPTPGGQAPVLVGQKTVSGSPAAAGDPLGFLIEILNIGTAPAYNVVITDVFPSFLTITNVNTNPSRATVKVNQNQVVVSISPLAVNELLRITISTIVKQGVTGTATNYNVAYFTYSSQNFVFSGYTNSALYQIGYSSSASGGLPPTGGREISTSHRTVNPLPALGALILLLGSALHLKKPWKNSNHLTGASWIRVASSVLIIFGICFNLVACAQGDSRIDEGEAPASVETSSPSPITPDVPTETHPIQTSAAATDIPSVLPDYPIPTPAFLAGSGNEEISFDISPIQRIVISSIDLDTIVKYVPYDGLSWKIAGLNTEVVWMGDTSWPGLGGNTGLSAHVSLPDGSDGPFRHLSELKEGDIVELYTVENKYVYSVRSQEVVSESDLSVLQSTDQSQITMITCTDWNEAMQRYLNRVIVYSDLVDIQPVGQPKSSQ